MSTLTTIIQLRNDSAENWALPAAQLKPLLPGEPAVEIITKENGKKVAKLKIGTSEDSTFGNTPYLAGLIDTIKVNGTILELAEDGSVDIPVPTKFSDLFDDSGLGALIALEEERAKTAEAELATEIAKANNAISAIIENTDEETLNSIKELAAWINEHGDAAEGMIEGIQNNAQAIADILDEEEGILALAQEYTDTKLSELPLATADIAGMIKYDDETIKKNENGQLYVAKTKFTTDDLEQGEQTLVLNGGSATE